MKIQVYAFSYYQIVFARVAPRYYFSILKNIFFRVPMCGSEKLRD